MTVAAVFSMAGIIIVHCTLYIAMKGGEVVEITEKDLEVINSMSSKTLTKDDIFAFRVVACDNQIDRDMERFDDAALAEMAGMYVGKTILKDHRPETDNQSARIYRAEVADGENGFKQLIVYAYVPRIDSMKDFIEQVETGVKKEVSVGCSVKERACSICGKRVDYCEHRLGKSYEGKMCYGVLKGIQDVYEISCVAVPAQKNVQRAFRKNLFPEFRGLVSERLLER